jgi:ubiquinol-cytochrome c reductase cytochrome b subunit
MIKVTRRTFAAAVVILAAIGWTGLTVAAVMTTPKEAEVAVDYSLPTDWMQLSSEEMAGVGYFRQENCATCHSFTDKESRIGPDLTKTSIHRNAAWMIEHFKAPARVRPGSVMPPIQLNDSQLNTLAAFLLKLNPENATAVSSAPDFVVNGAMVFVAQGCGGCHRVNGTGIAVGPSLNGLSERRARSWVEEHFLDPAKLSPGSIMPAYKLPPKDLANLTAYLFALPE